MLTKQGFAFRNKLAEEGIELTPQELEAVMTPHMMITTHGFCSECGEKTTLRKGICFGCFMKDAKR